MNYRKILILFISWRIITVALSFIVLSNFSMEIPLKLYGEVNLLKIWTSWDGGHYIGIASNGYLYAQQYAFFPFFPMFIKTVAFLIPNSHLAALLISNFSLLIALFFLYRIAKLYGLTEQAAILSCVYLLSFPTAFLLTAAFTESLFLALILSSLYFAKTKRWFTASIMSGLATMTKFLGVLFIIVLVIEYLYQQRQMIYQFIKKPTAKNIDEPIVYLLFFAPFGFYLYSFYLYWILATPLFFRDVQVYWGRSTSLVNPLQILTENFFKYFLTPINGLYFSLSVSSLEVLAVILFLLLLPSIFFRFGLGLTIFTFLTVTFTLFSGRVDSSLRYVLTAFPAFLLLGLWGDKNHFFMALSLIFFFMLQGILLLLFITGSWVG